MRKFLILAVLIILLVVIVGVSSQVALATVRPLRPGHPFFPVQDFAEQARARIVLGETDRAIYHLDLALQRTEDLVILQESEHALLAIHYLNRALDQAIAAITEAPEEDLTFLTSQLGELILKIDVALNNFQNNPAGQVEAVEKLRAKVATLEMLLANVSGIDQVTSDANLQQLIQDAQGAIDSGDDSGTAGVPPHNVLFPPGSPGALHEFFILDGEHAGLDCLACHSDGEYAGTPNLCIDCHVDQEPESHYGEDCAGCHTAFSWQDVNFDHGLIDTRDCKFCHSEEEPANHYAAQCSACHTTGDWAQIDFNHQAINTSDCQSCHLVEKPNNHYSGQCSACHNTSNWRQANFNHQAVGATDCKACHSGKKPANHYGGQCSACHNTSNWSQANFNHQAVGATDCQSCHSGRKPANHFGGQCSACHNTSNWSQA
ncbi:MAG: hypothetical protein WBG94_06245, partial [Anaerolineales bacterium]